MQSGLLVKEKDDFYDQVMCVIVSVLEEEILLLGGDFIVMLEKGSRGFEGIHGEQGYGDHKPKWCKSVRLLCFQPICHHILTWWKRNTN